MAKRKVRCGVYKITNLANGHKYIGSAKNVISRMTDHKRDLRKGVHANSRLQRAWDKYGEANFVFEVIEYCSEEVRFDREQSYLPEEKTLKALKDQGYYNLGPFVDSNKGRTFTEEQRLRLGERIS